MPTTRTIPVAGAAGAPAAMPLSGYVDTVGFLRWTARDLNSYRQP
jgi:hypothetical protein